METTREARPIAAAVVLALAGCAAVSLMVGDAIWRGIPDSDSLPTILMILGWLLLAWAVIVGAFVIVRAVRTTAHRGRIAPSDAVMLAASAAVVVALLVAYPVFGTGGGTG
ncbi:hypothetical protein E4U02_04835 [Microbacterium paludicola]|uniref:Uncharacterized protein n=1 Tax=Microbacterium paludicola TaxID=300019 RepID=A0A4Y9FW71_9MICO|nr:hypothetical protein [Microbacterium paludicola]MBF0815732.1 hypothetical protein [Microbacterium paludicola]TFU33570.1 hypothetical protein E4U02_04835 [Microbacterium paludicola]